MLVRDLIALFSPKDNPLDNPTANNVRDINYEINCSPRRADISVERQESRIGRRDYKIFCKAQRLAEVYIISIIIRTLICTYIRFLFFISNL